MCTSDNIMEVSEGETGMMAKLSGIFKHLGYKQSCSFFQVSGCGI